MATGPCPASWGPLVPWGVFSYPPFVALSTCTPPPAARSVLLHSRVLLCSRVLLRSRILGGPKGARGVPLAAPGGQWGVIFPKCVILLWAFPCCAAPVASDLGPPWAPMLGLLGAPGAPKALTLGPSEEALRAHGGSGLS